MNDHDDIDPSHDIVLSREEYNLLHAFHRMIPLPALSSGLTRVLCEEDLQVQDDDVTLPGSEEKESARNPRRTSHLGTLRQLRSPVGANQKPHHDIDLTKFTPRQTALEPQRPETS